jgi:hypothetical protein
MMLTTKMMMMKAELQDPPGRATRDPSKPSRSVLVGIAIHYPDQVDFHLPIP